MNDQDFVPVVREGACYAQRCAAEGDACDAECTRDVALAMAYVPVQRFRALYRPMAGLCAGTLFRELDKPFIGGRGRRCDHA